MAKPSRSQPKSFFGKIKSAWGKISQRLSVYQSLAAGIVIVILVITGLASRILQSKGGLEIASAIQPPELLASATPTIVQPKLAAPPIQANVIAGDSENAAGIHTGGDINGSPIVINAPVTGNVQTGNGVQNIQYNPERVHQKAVDTIDSLFQVVAALPEQGCKRTLEKHLAATKTIASRGISADAAILSVRLGYVQGYLRYLAQDWSSVLPLANDSSEESTLLRLQAALRVPSLAPVAKKEMAVLYRLLTRTPETDVFLLQYEFLQVVAQPDDSDPEALLVIDEKANALARTLIAGSGIETYPLLHDLGCLRLSVTYSYLESQCTLLEADQEAITPKAFSEVLDRSLELISEVTACEKQLSHSSVSISPASALGAAELVIKQHVMMNRVATLVVTLPQEHSARFEQRYAVDKATLLARINSLTTVNGGKLSNELCAGLFTLAQMEFIKNDISSAIDLLREARGIATRHEIEAMLSVKIDYVYAIAVTAVAREKMETSGLAGILPCSSQLNEAVTVFRYFEENSGRRPAPREDWIGQRADALLMTYILHVAANDLAKSDVIAKEIRQAVKSGGMPFLDQVRNSWADVLSRQTDSDVQEKVNQLYHIGG